MYFFCKFWQSDVSISQIGSHKISITQKWVICCHVWCVYEIGMRNPVLNSRGMSQITCICKLLISKSVHNYHFTASMCFNFVTASISLNAMCVTIVILGQISTSPINLFLYYRIILVHILGSALRENHSFFTLLFCSQVMNFGHYHHVHYKWHVFVILFLYPT